LATLMTPFPAKTASLAAATATTAVGTAVDCTGAGRVLVEVLNHTPLTAYTAGAFDIEQSTDGGTNWADVTDAVPLALGDGGTAASFPVTCPLTGSQALYYVIPHRDGPCQFRVGITTTVTGASVDANIYPIGL